jgi:hypothetical protein
MNGAWISVSNNSVPLSFRIERMAEMKVDELNKRTT